MTRHTHISYIKSWIRIAGYCFLYYSGMPATAALLMIAEVLGIIEEIGE